jgi:hypothetical protein
MSRFRSCSRSAIRRARDVEARPPEEWSRTTEASPRARRASTQSSSSGQFVLGPYDSDSARAVTAARSGAVVWNHGAAADDVQRLPGVVSVPSPASRCLVALGRAVAALRPAATIALVTAKVVFAGFAREGLERAESALGLGILACFSFRAPPTAVAAARADAILVCGPVGAEVVLFRALARLEAQLAIRHHRRSYREPVDDAHEGAPAPQCQPVASAPRLATLRAVGGIRAEAEDAGRRACSLPDTTPIETAV